MVIGEELLRRSPLAGEQIPLRWLIQSDRRRAASFVSLDRYQASMLDVESLLLVDGPFVKPAFAERLPLRLLFPPCLLE